MEDKPIKQPNTPDLFYLYKYRDDSDKTLDIIRNGKIWFSKPKEFNDPFDCGIDLCDDFEPDKVRQVLQLGMTNNGWSRGKIKKHIKGSFDERGRLKRIGINYIEQIKQSIRDRRDNLGVLSLSRTCESILMWSHYASSHKGICIQFNVANPNELFEVEYSSIIPRFTLYDTHIKRKGDVYKLLITKHDDWKYEKEWRKILDRGDLLYDIPGPITSIIFGLKTSSSYKSAVRDAASNLHDIRFMKCKPVKGKLGIEIVDA
jgi:hypothetical protein